MVVVNSRFLTQKITGAQRFAMEMSKHIRQLLQTVRFIAPHDILHKDLTVELNVKIVGRNRGHLWEQFDLPYFLYKNNKPLLVNFCNTAPLAYTNQIVTILDLSFLINPGWFSKRFFLFYKFLTPLIAKRSKKVITISEFSKQQIVKILKVPEEKIEIVYCGISEEIKGFSKKEFYNEYGEYILTVSSLEPRKNFRNLILAFNRLKFRSNVKLIIVGSENRIFADLTLRNLIQGDDRIIMTGYVSDKDLSGLYRHAMLLVYPSLYEGFGLPPLEAMACGCPVVVSSAASLPEVCGDAAFYVDPYDVDDIAKGIYKVLTDEKLQRELRQKGLERVKLFSWRDSAEKFISVMEEAIDD